MKCESEVYSRELADSNSGSNGPDSGTLSGKSSGTSIAGESLRDTGPTSSGSPTSAK